jgi:hypothetical protein
MYICIIDIMKKIYFNLLIILIIIGCKSKTTDAGNGVGINEMSVYGIVVETIYTEDVLFSVQGLAGVSIVVNGDTLAITDIAGNYSIEFQQEGHYTLYAQKDGYVYDSQTVNLYDQIELQRDFYLQKDNEVSHGWHAFNMGARISIDSDGLSLYSLGLREAYATKRIKLANNLIYSFSAKVKKDIMTQTIYFAVQPQINGNEWQYQSWMLDEWRDCIIEYEINDTTVLDSTLVYQDEVITDTLYIYPDSVDVVLKIGVEGNTDHPAGSFKDIIIREINDGK